jgi:hypothetical protein
MFQTMSGTSNTSQPVIPPLKSPFVSRFAPAAYTVSSAEFDAVDPFTSVATPR